MNFEALYTKYFDPLVYFAKCRVSDEETAEDIVQNVFYRVFRGDKVRLFANEQHAKVYLYQGVVYGCINYHAYRRFHDPLETADNVAPDEPARDYIRIEVYSQLYEAIQDLPKGCRDIMKLHYVEGWTSGQIAEILRKNANTVRNQIARGVLLLKQRYRVTQSL